MFLSTHMQKQNRQRRPDQRSRSVSNAGYGMGVRTTQPIKNGSFIAKYAGETINNSEADKHEDTCKFASFLDLKEISDTRGPQFI